MTTPNENITQAIVSAIEFGQQGYIKACKEQLRTIYAELQNNPLLLWETQWIDSLGKAVVFMIHLDLIDDEDKNIALAHWAYLFISKGIINEANSNEPDNEKLFQLRKERIILLKSFDDFFVDTLRSVYYPNSSDNDRDTYIEHRKIMLSRIPLLILSDIYHIEQQYQNLNNDEYLLEIANYLEQDLAITVEELKEAELLHQVLYKQIIHQKNLFLL